MIPFKLILISIGTIVFQWAFLQGLPLSQYGNPYVYVWILFILPPQTSRQQQLLIAFFIGSLMDSFEQSGGAHSIACLMLVLIKPTIETTLLGFRKPEEEEGLSALSLGAFITTTGVLVVCHHFVLFTLENYGFNHFGVLAIRTLLSSLLSLLLLVIIQALTARRYGKK
jgi:hypothetical protein